MVKIPLPRPYAGLRSLRSYDAGQGGLRLQLATTAPPGLPCLDLSIGLSLFSTGPCGGENAWGTNGNGVMQDGAEITMNLQYAAGHTGDFRMAYSCGATTENDMSGVRCSPWRAGCCRRFHLQRGRGGGRVGW